MLFVYECHRISVYIKVLNKLLQQPTYMSGKAMQIYYVYNMQTIFMRCPMQLWAEWEENPLIAN